MEVPPRPDRGTTQNESTEAPQESVPVPQDARSNEFLKTDTKSNLQVTDYMHPLWWAGRFQARFDQWRNEALQVHFNPEHRSHGELGQFQLHEEKVALNAAPVVHLSRHFSATLP